MKKTILFAGLLSICSTCLAYTPGQPINPVTCPISNESQVINTAAIVIPPNGM